MITTGTLEMRMVHLFHRDGCCPPTLWLSPCICNLHTQATVINNFALQNVIFSISSLEFDLWSLQSSVSACECPSAPLCRPRFSQPLKSPKLHFATSTLFIPLSRPTIGQLGRSAVERSAALHNELKRKRRRRRKERGQEVHGCRYETRCSPPKRRVGGGKRLD